MACLFIYNSDNSMATIKDRIESHIPQTITAGEESAFIGWVNEAQELLVHLVDEDDAQKYISSYPVTSAGLDIGLFRLITAHKDGIQAGMYPSHAHSALESGTYSGIYSASVNAPAAVIKDGKIYVYPSGGHITAFGVVKIADLTPEYISGMPISFSTACVLYAAMMAYKKYMNDLSELKDNAPVSSIPSVTMNVPTLDTEEFLETLSLSALPIPPTDATITADQATDPTVTAPTLNAPDVDDIGSTAQYNKVNPSLDFTNADSRATTDDIEMLNGEINRLSQELQMYAQQMSDELNRVNTAIQGFQSKVSHSLEQGRLTFTATDSQAKLKLNKELSDAQNKLTAAIENQRLILSGFNEKVQAVLGENQQLISAFQARMNKWSKESDLNATEYQGKLQAEITRYQTEIEKAFTHYNNSVNEIAFNNQVLDQKIALYTQQISMLKMNYDEAITAYLRSVQDDRYIPAPINPEERG